MTPLLPDANVWIHFGRARTPRALRQLALPYVQDKLTHVAEPIRFEVLRVTLGDERERAEAYLDTCLPLPTPETLWEDSTRLGTACRRANISIGGMDLVIATIALHHDAHLVTFDKAFERIAALSKLKVTVLAHPMG